MSKRPASSSTPAKSKRTKTSSGQKTSPGQTRLDTFFASSHHDQQPSSSKPTNPMVPKIHKGSPEIIDVDLLGDPVIPSSETEVKVAKETPIPRSLTSPVKFIQVKVAAADALPPSYATLSADCATFDPETYELPSSLEIPYSFLAHALSTVCATRSRITILDTLSNAFRVILTRHSQSLLPAIYLLSNTMSPPYSSLELNIGPSVISQAIQHVSGLTPSALRKLYNNFGDIGDVAFAAKSNTRTLIPHPPLLVSFVYKTMYKIATSHGQGAAKQKQKLVETLLVAAKGEESRFLARTLSQNLRVGAVRTSLLTALARCFVLSSPCRGSTPCPYHVSAKTLATIQPLNGESKKGKNIDTARETLNAACKESETLVRKVFVQHPDYEHILGSLIEDGLEMLAQKVPLTVGIPIYPTLGTPIRSFEEVYERLKGLPFTAELKYDGQRAQIHAHRQVDGHIMVRLFSRHLEDMTSKYPDVVALVEEMCGRNTEIQSFIMDSEIVAINPADGSLKDFQTLASRARKDVRLGDVSADVGVFVFDLMYLNEQALLTHPFRSRRALLREHFPPFVPERKELARFQHVESCDSEDGKTSIEEFWESDVGRRDTEGLMVKLLDNETVKQQPQERVKPLLAVYDADKRTYAWMKLKKDYVNGLGDSLDLVPIGAWHGNGRKAQWWSPILLGVWDAKKGRVVGVCKCMSGFSDNFYKCNTVLPDIDTLLKALSERYNLSEDSELCSRVSEWNCETGGLKPDVYFKPQEVWEIRGAEVTVSPVSVAALGLVSSSKGLSLRFPRFVRIRQDKSVEQASDTVFLANMWRKQKGEKDLVDEGDELIDVDLRNSEVEESDASSDSG
ncbi:hypothetical protein D9758_001891 [Tetrapyrgos nigripes]|uniref:DNA ligase n=1 Tax=Tetrapyrgos nigripes TaxID=182062 RepID=A0A8H5LV70_9AGAR|nr:hypothetical protein D9758_001891 [Tetrapyrgos nigripes]